MQNKINEGVPFYKKEWFKVVCGILILIVAIGLLFWARGDTSGKSFTEPSQIKSNDTISQEIDYLQRVEEESYFYSDSFDSISYYLADATYTDSWIEGLAYELSMVQWISEDIILDDEVPAKYAKAHKFRVKAAQEYILFVDMVVDGIDNNNSASIEKASKHLTKGAEYTNKASDLILK